MLPTNCISNLIPSYTQSQQSNSNSRNFNQSANMIDAKQGTKSHVENTSSDATKIENIQDESRYPYSRAANHVTNSLSNSNLGNKKYRSKQSILWEMVFLLKLLILEMLVLKVKST